MAARNTVFEQPQSDGETSNEDNVEVSEGSGSEDAPLATNLPPEAAEATSQDDEEAEAEAAGPPAPKRGKAAPFVYRRPRATKYKV